MPADVLVMNVILASTGMILTKPIHIILGSALHGLMLRMYFFCKHACSIYYFHCRICIELCFSVYCIYVNNLCVYCLHCQICIGLGCICTVYMLISSLKPSVMVPWEIKLLSLSFVTCLPELSCAIKK